MNGSAGGGRRGTVLMLLLAAALLLPGLGLYPLLDVDEGAFGEATREMLASGNWLSTTLDGAPRYDKPILIYWLQALSVGALGLGEFALRLPSALAALAWVAAIVRFAAPRVGAGGGEAAGWIAATTLGVLAIGRAATADALLNALLAAAMFDAWRVLEEGRRSARLRLYAWIGLGLLTKGPIAVLIPAAVTLLYCASTHRLRDWARAVLDPVGWLLLLAIAAPWYAAQLAIHGRDFVEGFFVRHNLERFGGTLEGHGGSLAYYFVFVPLLLLPWTGLLGAALRNLRPDWRDPLARYLWMWFGFVFVFFSASGTKLPHYVLYGLTPLFVLLARHREQARSPAWVLLWPTLMLGLAAAAPPLLQAIAERIADPHSRFYAEQARRSLEAASWFYYAATLAALAAWIALLVRWRGRPAWRRAAVAAGLLSAVFGYAFAPWLGDVLAGPVKRAALVARGRPETAVQWEMHAPSFSVYRGRVSPSRPPQPGELALTREDLLPPGESFEVLFRQGGVALVKRR